MTARSRMTMRATVERNAEADKDPDNNPMPATWEALDDLLPCWLWSDTERDVVGDIVAVIEDLRLLVPLDADVTTADRIHGIADKGGAVIDDHLMKIVADRIVHPSHRELSLEVMAWPGS